MDKDFLKAILIKAAERVADGVVFQTGVRVGNAACDNIAKFLGFKTDDKKTSSKS